MSDSEHNARDSSSPEPLMEEYSIYASSPEPESGDQAASVEDDRDPQDLAKNLPYGLKALFLYTEYAMGLLKEKVGFKRMKPDTGTLEGAILGVDTCAELETMVAQVVRAWNNRVTLEFSIKEVDEALRAGGGRPRDEILQEKFKPPHRRTADGQLSLVDTPTVYVDKDDRVVAWYIPAAFTVSRSVRTMEAVRREPGALKLGGENWRNARQSFANPERCVVGPGNENFSVCWYNQGFDHKNSLPAPSASLKNPSGRRLLKRLRPVNALIGALFSLVHPALYEQQMDTFVALFNNADKLTADTDFTKELFDSWTTPFNAFAVIANRETELHRDNKGGRFCLDMLATFGSYTGGRLDMPLLGARYVYNPGTAFIMPGYLFQHGAGKTQGERLCIASFFRPGVARGALGDEYQELLPPTVTYLKDLFGYRLPTYDEKNIWE